MNKNPYFHIFMFQMKGEDKKKFCPVSLESQETSSNFEENRPL